MVWKRLKQPGFGGVVLAALALGGSASAGAAAGGSGSSWTMATSQVRSNGGLPALSSTRAAGTVAHKNAKATVTGVAAANAGAAPLATPRGGSVGTMRHVRDGWIRDPYLTDHEQYVRHHQRLAR